MRTKIKRPTNNDIMALTLWLKDNAGHNENRVLDVQFHVLTKQANASPDLDFDNFNTSHVRIYCNAVGLTEPSAAPHLDVSTLNAEINMKLAEINRRLEELEETVTQGAML